MNKNYQGSVRFVDNASVIVDGFGMTGDTVYVVELDENGKVSKIKGQYVNIANVWFAAPGSPELSTLIPASNDEDNGDDNTNTNDNNGDDNTNTNDNNGDDNTNTNDNNGDTQTEP